ncbi:MAG: DUF1232 domain-containing protein [Candidatus Promineifilaceae bacterium]|nr:DUF1232 domain-containing protein [Candidatus Promineifilaceae bacterium]
MLDQLLPNVLNPRYWLKTLQEIRLVWALIQDPRVPGYLKLLPALFVVYLLVPFDLIPGFIPVLGQLDDIALLLLLVPLFIRLAPDDLVEEYKAEMNLRRIES